VPTETSPATIALLAVPTVEELNAMSVGSFVEGPKLAVFPGEYPNLHFKKMRDGYWRVCTRSPTTGECTPMRGRDDRMTPTELVVDLRTRASAS
jgi:hypothetical protein